MRREGIWLRLDQLILVVLPGEDHALPNPGVLRFTRTDSGNFADALARHWIEPVKIEFGAGALPIYRFPFDDNLLRVRLAIQVAGYCIELPASGVLAILCQASFSGCLVADLTANLFQVVLPRVASRSTFERRFSSEVYAALD